MSWRIAAQTMPAPSLDLLFTNRSLVDNISGQNLITFTRASSATYVDSNRLIRTAAVNEPRFDHNPVTGESLGLLIEGQRTNVGTYSEQIDNDAWVFEFANKTVTANSITAPDGTVTADMVTIAGFTQIQQPNSNIGGPKTFSIFLKAGTLSVVQLRLFSGTAPVERQVDFNLSTGTATVVSGSAVTVGFIQVFPNGWYRCVITVTDSAATSGSTIRASASSAETFYAWGAQLEAGTFPTSYIPTTTAAVTRAVDTVNITGANFANWYNQIEGTTFCNFRAAGGTSTYFENVFSYATGTTSGQQALYRNASNAIGYGALGIGVPVVTLSSWSGINHKAIAAYRANSNISLGINGILSVSGSSNTSETSNRLGIGEGYNQIVVNKYNGTIARLTYWPTRLPGNMLQRLTQ